MIRIRHTRGFSLTELLVAMVVGLVLMAGLVTLMVNSKKNYAQQDYNARLQENARFAMQFLTYDIRMAGYFGCSNNIINDSSVTAFNVPDPTTDPDKVTITYGAPYDENEKVFITQVSGSGSLVWTLNRLPDDWDSSLVGDEVVVADCGSAAVTTVSAIDTDNNQITVDGNLGRLVDPSINDSGPLVVRRFISNTYAVENSGESGIPVLTRNGQELVEGIEDIRLLYQAVGGANYETGASAPDTPRAVQLGALVRSISNENLEAGQNREFGSGADITLDTGGNSDTCEDDEYQILDECVAVAPLRGQRHVFSTGLSVRNRPL